MYEITIKKIDRTEYPEKENRYFDKKTGEETRYTYTDSDNLTKKEFETGKILVREESQEVFTQRKDELDVEAIAVYINSK
jgi:hypothetical protein